MASDTFLGRCMRETGRVCTSNTCCMTNKPVGSFAAGYPDSNPKTVVGLTKPVLHVIPPVAILALGQAMQNGAKKYGAMNWREHSVSSTIYFDAALRHMLSWLDGEDLAEDSGVHHLAHAMACLAIVLDARASGKLNDNRPTPGTCAAEIKKQTHTT